MTRVLTDASFGAWIRSRFSRRFSKDSAWAAHDSARLDRDFSTSPAPSSAMWRIFAHLDLNAATFSALRAWIFFSNAARFAMDSPSPKGVCSLNVLRDLAGALFAVETLKHCHRVG